MNREAKREAIKAGGDGLRIHQALARQLGTEILQGKYEPGDSVGGEIETSDRLGISRTSYREAIRILIAKGLIESKPKAGTHVLPRRRWNLLDPDMLAWMFADKKPDPHFVRDLFELRGIIETEAAALAAERRSEAHLEAMATALEGMRVHTLAAEAGQAADQDFHSALLDAAENIALASLIGSVGSAVRWTTHFKLSVNKAPRNSWGDHEAVYLAVKAGDPEAARQAMRELLHFARIDVMKLVG